VIVDAGTAAEGEPDAGPGGVDPTQYCESIVDIFCPFYLRCGRMAVADVDACKPVFLQACNAKFEPIFVSLENAGLVTLSQAGIDACKAQLDTISCDQQILDLDGDCAQMWQGTQKAGDPCGPDFESFTCGDGTACAVDASRCGTCKRVVPDGSSCEPDDVTCGSTSECSEVTLACQARAHVGEPCAGDIHCVLGASCDNQVCVGRTYPVLGAPCDLASGCPYASACLDDGTGNNTSTCVETVELGAACSATAPCDSGFCDAAQTQKCIALAHQGEPCTRGDQCETGVCQGTTCSTVPSACFNPSATP
jgi:hypothetical protein